VGTNVGISHIPKGYVPVGKVVGMIIIVGTCTHHRSQVSTCMYDRRTDSQTHRGKIVYRSYTKTLAEISGEGILRPRLCRCCSSALVR
jgi:hypothetical protein